MSDIEITMYVDRSSEPSVRSQNVFVNFYTLNFQRLGATIYIESNQEGTELNFTINGKLVCTLREEAQPMVIPASSMKSLVIKHAIITPTCRENRGNDGAFEESVERIREQYYKSLLHYPLANYHLKLELEDEESNQ